MNPKVGHAIFQSNAAGGVSKLNLVPGRIFYGHILKLFPNDRALLKLGNEHIHARLEAPLVAGRSYWFKVATSGRTPRLRVLQPHETSQSATQMLEGLGLSYAKPRAAAVRMFMRTNVPFSKEMVEKGGKWLQSTNSPRAALAVMKQMAARQLPFTRAVFDLLLAARQTSAFHEQIGQLAAALHDSSEQFPSIQKLRTLLSRWMVNPGASPEDVRDAVRQTITQFGPRPPQGEQILQPLLLDVMLQTQSKQMKQYIQQFLMQLISQQWNGVGEFQTTFQLPLHWGGHSTDAVVTWEGKKRKNGTLDADYCRILFSLHLAHLQETVVDVSIQKRSVAIRVYNDTHRLAPALERLQPVLREKLEAAGFRLSSLRQMNDSSRAELSAEKHGLSGVDVRI